ncbi:head-tail adaptor protein [Marivivens marinus]|uniref:head-tail adaptor protein n=1 Tax=Marivivens marinus TaxID=3110173 RepID=UPI003B84A2F2
MKRPRLNRKLVLEAPVRVPDGAGGYSVTWTALGTLWADLDARTGREAAGIATPLSKAAYRIVLRAAPVGSPRRPLPEQRLRDGTRVFQINAVTEWDADARFLVCHANEEVVT